MNHIIDIFNCDCVVHELGLWVMYWDKCHWLMHILNNSKCIWSVHPSNWDALGAINIYWDQCMYWGQSHWTKYTLHIFNLLCANVFGQYIPVTGMHWVLSIYIEINVCIEGKVTGQSTHCISLTFTSQLLGYTKWYQSFVDMMSLQSMPLDETHVACL